MAAKLGLLAGGGPLPRQVVEACRRSGRDVFVVAFEGQTDPATVEGGVDHLWTRLGNPGPALKALHRAGCAELVMIGPVRRPSLTELRLDLTTARFLGRVGAKALGDDGLLRAVIAQLEDDGFSFVGVHEIVGDLLATPGTWGRHRPDASASRDIARALDVADVLGRVDVGQAVVVQQGLVLGVEAIEGTDKLLERCAELARPGPGGVLVKIKKPGQDERADLPTIGTNTVSGAKRAGLRGIAVEAGATIVVDLEATVAAADAAGLFLHGLQRGQT